MDMGSFLMERGEYNNAIRSYMRAKEYCANSRQVRPNVLTPRRFEANLPGPRSLAEGLSFAHHLLQIAENCLSIVELAIFTREWSAYGNNLTRTEVLTEASASPK